MNTDEMTRARRASVPPTSFTADASPESVLSLFNRVLDRVRVDDDLLELRERDLIRRDQDAAVSMMLGPLEAARQRSRELDERERHLIEFEATLVQKSYNLRATEHALRDWDMRLGAAEKRFREAESILMQRADQWRKYSRKVMAVQEQLSMEVGPPPMQAGPPSASAGPSSAPAGPSSAPPVPNRSAPVPNSGEWYAYMRRKFTKFVS